jgi:hypothetical protein
MNAEMSSLFKELTAKYPRAFALSAGPGSAAGTHRSGGLFQLLSTRPKDASAAHFPFFSSDGLRPDRTTATPSGGIADRFAVGRETRSAADGASWLLKHLEAPFSGSPEALGAKKRTPPVVSQQRSAIPPPTLCAREASEDDDGRYLGWFGDGTVPYPEALWAKYRLPLERLLIVRTPNAEETWRLGAEACGSGLFRALCLQPSAPTDGTTLRRLQLEAERHGVTVALLTDASLPHWTLTARWWVPSDVPA